jgi:serine/threonine-protein kinase
MPTESQLLNNRYKLLAQIAAGGMARVYKAQDIMLNRSVAVKILRESFAEDPAFQKRFVREAQSAANLSHPNIRVYDFGAAATATLSWVCRGPRPEIRHQ